MDPPEIALLAGGGPAILSAAYWGVGSAVTGPGRRLLDRWVLSRVETEAPIVALTFDDGPDPNYCERFIEGLAQARATFFVLGEKVRRWPELARSLTHAGHEVACHGDTHRSLARLGPRSTTSALRRARSAIAEAIGTAPSFYRPAYGAFNLPAWIEAPRLGMRRTLWTAWARDWEDSATPESIAARILRAAKPGAILLLHDADGSPGAPDRTLRALPAILGGLASRGLVPVTLSDLAGAAAAPA